MILYLELGVGNNTPEHRCAFWKPQWLRDDDKVEMVSWIRALAGKMPAPVRAAKYLKK